MHLTCRCGCGAAIAATLATVADQVNVPQMQLTRKQLRVAAATDAPPGDGGDGTLGMSVRKIALEML